MSNQGRALLTSLNAGDYSAVDQYADLSDLDIKIVNSHIHELFERAIKAENFKLFRTLLKIPKVLVSSAEYCALQHAATLGLVEYVSELARMGTVNGNLQGKSGDTALIASVKGNWSQKKALDLVRAIILIPKLRLNIRDNQGRTALHLAMGKEWYEVVNVLMDAGGNPKVEDEDEVSAVTLAGQQFLKIPGDLFQRVLNFQGEAQEDQPEEASPTLRSAYDEDSSKPDPYSQQVSQQSSMRTPGMQVNSPIPQDDDDDSNAPIIKQVQTFVQDFAATEPPMQVQHNGPVVKAAEDTADLFTVMEGQAVDDSLEKSFLFSPSKNQSWRIHRKAVLESIEDIASQLNMTGEALTPADCVRKDPATGLNLWQSAAVHGHFLTLLKTMSRNKRWPEAAELMTRTEDGRSLTDFLDENAQLSAVLNDAIWTAKPKLLAALIAGLPERRIRSLGPLVAKTNLLILNGVR
ncbi:MAG: hypothetical protein RLZZ519_2333 [Bacteroidota bacterium]|jgi:ankyrin repeat protein